MLKEFDTNCVIDVGSKQVKCTGYYATVNGVECVKYLNSEGVEFCIENLEEAIKRKEKKETLEHQASTVRYCHKSLNGIVCNSVLVRGALNESTGKYTATCPTCGSYHKNYNTCYPTPLLKTDIKSTYAVKSTSDIKPTQTKKADAIVSIPENEVVLPQQPHPIYYKRKAVRANTKLSTTFEKPATVDLFDAADGFWVRVRCVKDTIPAITDFMFQLEPEAGDVYSDALVDNQSQTIVLLDEDLRLLNNLIAIVIAREINLGNISLNGSTPIRIAGKYMREIMYKNKTYYIAVDEAFDYTQTIYYECVDGKGKTRQLQTM